MAAFFIILLVSSVVLSPPLSGRLHPGLIPGTIAVIGLTWLSWSLARRPAQTGRTALLARPSATVRALAAATLAIVILALGTQDLGLLPTVFVAGTLTALGVPGTSLTRGLAVGAGLAALCALVFVVLLRQPLPLLPGW